MRQISQDQNNLNQLSSEKNLQSPEQSRIKSMKTPTTVVGKKEEDEDLAFEQTKNSRFKQQRLPAWRPVPTIMDVVISFIVFGIIFIILGIILLIYSNKVHSISKSYENCGDINTNCEITIDVDQDIDKPVFVYYQLIGFYQNSRRYVKSKNIDQLLGESDGSDGCDPAKKNSEMSLSTEVSINEKPLTDSNIAIPCGLLAKTFFNDSFTFSIGDEAITVDDSDIAFEKDRKLYSKNKYPDLQWLDITDQHFLVWMRPSGLPDPKKLWGQIDRNLKKGEKIKVSIANNYDVSAYSGKKKIILSNANAFGGKNNFLSISYIVVGCLGIVCAAIFAIGYKLKLEKENQ